MKETWQNVLWLLSVRCPKCGAAAGYGCHDGAGGRTKKLGEQHLQRLYAAMAVTA